MSRKQVRSIPFPARGQGGAGVHQVGEETGLRCIGFHSAARFCDAAEKRMEEGERREAERLGCRGVAPASPSALPARPAPRFPACRPLTARTSPPPPGLGAFLGNPSGGRTPSRGIPANTLPHPGHTGPCLGGGERGTHTSAQTRVDRALSSRRGIPGTPPRALTRTHTHAHTHTKPARGAGPPGQLAALRGRTSRGYSLSSLSVSPAG